MCVFFWLERKGGGLGVFLSLSDSVSVHFFSLTLSLSLWRSVSVVGFYLCVWGVLISVELEGLCFFLFFCCFFLCVVLVSVCVSLDGPCCSEVIDSQTPV